MLAKKKRVVIREDDQQNTTTAAPHLYEFFGASGAISADLARAREPSTLAYQHRDINYNKHDDHRSQVFDWNLCIFRVWREVFISCEICFILPSTTYIKLPFIHSLDHRWAAPFRLITFCADDRVVHNVVISRAHGLISTKLHTLVYRTIILRKRTHWANFQRPRESRGRIASAHSTRNTSHLTPLFGGRK